MVYNAYKADEQYLLDGSFDCPFELTEAREVIVSVLNDDSKHWLAFRVEKATACVSLFDSYTCPDEIEEAERRSAIEYGFTKLFNLLCGQEWADETWRAMQGSWHCEWPETYQQTNTDDCGAHAIQNAVDLAYTSHVQQHHDAAMLRYRAALRIKGLLDGSMKWGYQDPFKNTVQDQVSIAARARSGKNHFGQQGAVHGVGEGDGLRNALQQAIRKATEGRVPPAPELENVSGSMPVFPHTIEYRPAIIAILRAAGPQGLPWMEIETRFGALSRALGRPLGDYWRARIRTVCRKSKGVFVTEDTLSGNTVLVDQHNEYAPPSALAFYGPDMAQTLQTGERHTGRHPKAPRSHCTACAEEWRQGWQQRLRRPYPSGGPRGNGPSQS